MHFTSPVPFAASAVKAPRKVDIHSLQVIAIEPYELVRIARSHAPLDGMHDAIFIYHARVSHAAIVPASANLSEQSLD